MPSYRAIARCLYVVILLQACLARKIHLKINLGGEAVDGFMAEGEALDVDESMPKMRYHGTIGGGGPDLNVFKTQRFSRNEDLVLNIPVPDGIYAVTLLFAETWQGAFEAGKRVFDVRERFAVLWMTFANKGAPSSNTRVSFMLCFVLYELPPNMNRCFSDPDQTALSRSLIIWIPFVWLAQPNHFGTSSQV